MSKTISLRRLPKILVYGVTTLCVAGLPHYVRGQNVDNISGTYSGTLTSVGNPPLYDSPLFTTFILNADGTLANFYFQGWSFDPADLTYSYFSPGQGDLAPMISLKYMVPTEEQNQRGLQERDIDFNVGPATYDWANQVYIRNIQTNFAVWGAFVTDPNLKWGGTFTRTFANLPPPSPTSPGSADNLQSRDAFAAPHLARFLHQMVVCGEAAYVRS